jgi:hypothetical protein
MSLGGSLDSGRSQHRGCRIDWSYRVVVVTASWWYRSHRGGATAYRGGRMVAVAYCGGRSIVVAAAAPSWPQHRGVAAAPRVVADRWWLHATRHTCRSRSTAWWPQRVNDLVCQTVTCGKPRGLAVCPPYATSKMGASYMRFRCAAKTNAPNNRIGEVVSRRQTWQRDLQLKALLKSEWGSGGCGTDCGLGGFGSPQLPAFPPAPCPVLPALFPALLPMLPGPGMC